LKDLAEQEQKRQQEQEEAKLAILRELEAKRAAEKAAREQVTSLYTCFFLSHFSVLTLSVLQALS
jgi:hypothetical protein